MIFFQSIYAKPMSSAMAHTSPTVPPLLPTSRSIDEGSWSSTSSPFMARCIMLRGVAAVVASVYAVSCPGTGHDVMAVGKLTRRKHLPTSAGLKGFCPRPPNVILPTPIATSAPMMMIHIGRLLGRFMPRSRPVRAAEPSHTVQRVVFRRNLAIAHSKSTHATTLVAQTMAEPMPKK